MPANDSSTANQQLSIERISAPLGTEEYERQFAQQSSSAVQLIARMPLVRVVCGFFAAAFGLMVLAATILLVRSQIANGLSAWDFLTHLGTAMITWWIVSMHGRIALCGEFDIGVGLFAPRQINDVSDADHTAVKSSIG